MSLADQSIENFDYLSGFLGKLSLVKRAGVKNIYPHLEMNIRLLKMYCTTIPDNIEGEAVEDIKIGLQNMVTHCQNYQRKPAISDLYELYGEGACCLNLALKTLLEKIAFDSKRAESCGNSAEEELEKVEKIEGDCSATLERAKGSLTAAQESIDSQLKEIEELCKISRAIVSRKTSEQVAGMFSDRKDECKRQRRRWIWIMGLAIAAFIAVAIYMVLEQNLLTFLDDKRGVGAAIAAILVRAVLFAPQVWLVYFASQKIKEVDSLEEAYAHKQAFIKLAAGYKDSIQMGDPTSDLYKRTIEIAAKDTSYIFRGERVEPSNDLSSSKETKDADTGQPQEDNAPEDVVEEQSDE